MQYPGDVTEPTSTQADFEALKALEADAPELERIESLLDRFNVFELVGFVNNELTHSDFLAFLLDPKRNDGLGDLFIKGVLRETLTLAQKTLPPLVFGGLDRVLENLDGMDLSQTLVRREDYDIDILLTNEDYKLAVIIENKIGATEGHGQLVKYDSYVRHIYPRWDLLKIYLTPHGDAPSHNEYVPFHYGGLCSIMDRILKDGGLTLSPDVKVFMEHYAAMVRRRIVGDTEIVELCERLYLKHKPAFDLVYKHRPDVQADIRDLLLDLIGQKPKLALDHYTKDGIKFGVRDWDTPVLLTAEKFTASGRILLFQFWNAPNVLNLDLWVGAGPEEIRQKLLEMIRLNAPDTFMKPPDSGALVYRHPILIYRHPILKPETYNELDRKQREEEIRGHWNAFLDRDLPRIEAALRAQEWIWESFEESDST